MADMEKLITDNKETLTIKELAEAYISMEEDINRCDAILSNHDEYGDPTEEHLISDSEMGIILEMLSHYKCVINTMKGFRYKIVTQ